MKTIHFNPLQKSPLYWLTILVPILLLLGISHGMSEYYPKIGKYVQIAGFILALLAFMSQFFHKNYVEWNKRGMNIKVNRFWPLTISFASLEQVEFNDDEYVFFKTNGETKSIYLTDIDQGCRAKLMHIIREQIEIDYYSPEESHS